MIAKEVKRLPGELSGLGDYGITGLRWQCILRAGVAVFGLIPSFRPPLQRSQAAAGHVCGPGDERCRSDRTPRPPTRCACVDM